MKVAKEFRWEAAHRLPGHDGGCRHLHGHSYRMTVELTGPLGEHGMVADFHEIKSWLRPLIADWDHATLVADTDQELLDVVRSHGWRHAVLPFDTTAENLCRFAAEFVVGTAGDRLETIGVTRVRVRVMETETCYAEYDLDLRTGE